MSKEIDYQNKAQNCIEQLISQRTGITTSMYTEEFDTTYNYALQDDTWIITQSLPQFQIVGLRDKIKELNQLTIAKSIQEFGLSLTVDVVVDGQTFKLFTDGEWAWPGPDDEAKLLAAMKAGSSATLTARSGKGTQTQDTFSLRGFTAAMEDAEKRCS